MKLRSFECVDESQCEWGWELWAAHCPIGKHFPSSSDSYLQRHTLTNSRGL